MMYNDTLMPVKRQSPLHCKGRKDEDMFVDVLSSGKFMFPLSLLSEFLFTS